VNDERFDPDPRQERVLAHRGGPLLVTGPPGSGKTAVLRERFARLVEGGADPDRVALFTLSRRAAREARDQLIRRLARSVGELPVFTVHGFAFRVLSRRFQELDYSAPPKVLSAPEQYAVVRELLGSHEEAERWSAFRDLLAVPAFQRQVADFVLRCQERLLHPARVAELAERSGRQGHREIAQFYGRYLDAMALAQGDEGVDFAGLLFQAVSLLERGIPEQERFEHVLVDDYQDATHAADAVVGALGGAADSVVVAADPDGHVFAYRGGSREPLDRLDRTLPGLDRVALTVSHRLGRRVDSVAALADPAREAPPPAGGVEARLFAHPGEEVEAVAHELLRHRVDRDTPWAQMAVVLRRYGPYLTALRHALTRHDIPFIVVAEQASLATEPAVRPVIDLLRYVFRPERRADLVEALLVSPLGGLDPHQLRRLRREARIRDRTLLQLVEGDDGGRPLHGDLAGSVDGFRSLVDEVAAWKPSGRPDDLFFQLWRGVSHFADLVAAADRSADPSSSRAATRELDALAAFSSTMARFSERRPGAGIDDYLATLEAAEFGPDPWVPPEERHPDAVRIISAHRAQGLEFDVVLVAGCVEGEFPSLSHGYPLVFLDDLVAPRTPWERAADRLAEERRLFRLAATRARHSTVLFASTSSGARNPRTPSRFAARLGLSWGPAREEAPPATSLRSMEAVLRNRLADGSTTPARRLAAAAALAAVGARPAEWWGLHDWTDPGTPMFEGDLLTSYSRLSAMENCALQYLYQVELGLDPEQTYQMWVGSTVHGIVDRTQKGEIPRDLTALHAALDDAWRPGLFPNRAVEHRRYLDARDMLSRWFRGEAGEPERSEVWFEFPLDGASIRGRIDAVFRMNNGHLRVVDYKTSRYPISQEAARTDLQLAAYYLALKRTPELAELGEVGYLQLDYLGKGSQRDVFVHREVSPSKIPGYEQWAEDTIRDLVARVRREEFGFNPEADCQFCSFRTICPRWPEGKEAPVGGRT